MAEASSGNLFVSLSQSDPIACTTLAFDVAANHLDIAVSFTVSITLFPPSGK